MGYTFLPAKNFDPILSLDLKRDQSRGQIMAKEDIVTLKRKIHIRVFIHNLGKPAELSPTGSRGASESEAIVGHQIWVAFGTDESVAHVLGKHLSSLPDIRLPQASILYPESLEILKDEICLHHCKRPKQYIKLEIEVIGEM